MFKIWIILAACFIGLTNCVSNQVLTKNLHDYLFADYDTNLLPICSEGQNVTVKIDIALRQIVELLEPKQVLLTNIWIRLNWNDCRLTWNPAEYNNLTDLMVLFNDIWFPDITLYDSAADEVMFPGRESYSAYVKNTGAISYNFPSVLTSVCRVDVRYFPFDTQRCPLQFGSWTYHGLDLDVINKHPYGDTDTFVQNNEWDLKGVSAERRVSYYNCCLEPYPDVTFYVVIRRRPSFYVLTMLFPCILVSLVSAMTFLLPAESGEKVSLEITVLLSLAVFLLVVSEALPPSSDNFPVIGSYFAAAMVLVSVSLLQTILIVNVFYRGANGRKVPGWLKKICFQYIGRIVFVQPSESRNKAHHTEKKSEREVPWRERASLDTYLDLPSDSSSSGTNSNSPREEASINTPDSIPNGGTRFHDNDQKLRFFAKSIRTTLEDPTVKLLEKQNEQLEYIVDSMKVKLSEESVNSEWRDIANIMDRLFLVIYIVVTLITTLAFLLQCL